MKIRYLVTDLRGKPQHQADTKKEAEEWIEDRLKPDMMGTLEFVIKKVYSNR